MQKKVERENIKGDRERLGKEKMVTDSSSELGERSREV